MIATLKFYKPDEFAKFVKENGLKWRDTPQSIFISTQRAANVYNTRRRINTIIPDHRVYSALCIMGNVNITVTLDPLPQVTLGEDWVLNMKKHIEFTTDIKRECIEQLQKLGVNEKDITELVKVKVSTLREMIDASNAEWTEMTFKKKVDEATHYKYKTKEFGELKLDVSASKERGDSVTYTLTLDYSEEWKKMEASVDQALMNFIRYEGDLHVSDR